MSDTTDVEITEAVLDDPFHKGLAEHGEFIGFPDDIRQENEGARGFREGKAEAMTDEEVETARKRMGLMAKASR